MFKGEYQGGPFVEVFGAQGRDTLSKKCKVTGNSNTIQKQYNKDVKSYVYVLEGEPTTTKIQFPKEDKQSLFLTQKFLVFQLYLLVGRPFSFEVAVTDHAQNKKRIFFSSNLKDISITPLHAKFPLTILSLGSWLNLCLDLDSLVSETFNGPKFRAVDSFTVTANCRLKRVFTLRSPPIDTSEDQSDDMVEYNNSEPLPKSVQLMTTSDVSVVTQILSFGKLCGKASEGSCVPQTTPVGHNDSSSRREGPETHIAFGTKVVIPPHIRKNSFKENRENSTSKILSRQPFSKTKLGFSPSEEMVKSPLSPKGNFEADSSKEPRGIDISQAAIQPRPPKTSSAGKIKRPIRLKPSSAGKTRKNVKSNSTSNVLGCGTVSDEKLGVLLDDKQGYSTANVIESLTSSGNKDIDKKLVKSSVDDKQACAPLNEIRASTFDTGKQASSTVDKYLAKGDNSDEGILGDTPVNYKLDAAFGNDKEINMSDSTVQDGLFDYDKQTNSTAVDKYLADGNASDNGTLASTHTNYTLDVAIGNDKETSMSDNKVVQGDTSDYDKQTNSTTLHKYLTDSETSVNGTLTDALANYKFDAAFVDDRQPNAHVNEVRGSSFNNNKHSGAILDKKLLTSSVDGTFGKDKDDNILVDERLCNTPEKNTRNRDVNNNESPLDHGTMQLQQKPRMLPLTSNNPVFTFASMPRSPRSSKRKMFGSSDVSTPNMEAPPEVVVSLAEDAMLKDGTGARNDGERNRGASLADDFCKLSDDDDFDNEDNNGIQKLLQSSLSPRHSPMPSHHQLRQSIRSSMLKEIPSPVKENGYDALNYQSDEQFATMNQSTASSWRFDTSDSSDSFNRTQLEDSLNDDGFAKAARQAIADIPMLDDNNEDAQSNCSDDTTYSTWRTPPQSLQGNKYQNEMKPPGEEPDLTATICVDPRRYSDAFSPPIVLGTPSEENNNTVSAISPLKSPPKFSGANNQCVDEEEELDLLYDPVLNCYFDPKTHKYYELA